MHYCLGIVPCEVEVKRLSRPIPQMQSALNFTGPKQDLYIKIGLVLIFYLHFITFIFTNTYVLVFPAGQPVKVRQKVNQE